MPAAAGATLTRIPYRTTPDALIALRNGDVRMLVETVVAVMGQIRDGDARLPAVSTGARIAALPEVPTVAKAGGPAGIDLATWYALAFAAQAPEPILSPPREALCGRGPIPR